jgi:predicted dienelactone hydrolase
MNRRIRPLLFAIAIASAASGRANDYDPLAKQPLSSKPIELTVKDEKRMREIPIRTYLPDGAQAVPIVLFSHGLGGSRSGSSYLGEHWAARGFVAVYLQHPGSDDSIWKDKPATERLTALRDAANLQNFLDRARDVHIVLDQLEKSNKDQESPLWNRLAFDHVGMSGHSFGAVTAQAVSGQAFLGQPRFTDRRVKAAVLMSPGPPRREEPAEAFGKVEIPWMLLTGTKDSAPIGEIDFEARLKIFPALPVNNKYELVLHNAEHSAFTDRPLPGDSERRNPNHHKAILAMTTAFWDAYLRGDARALEWLKGSSARKVLEPDDRWQLK